jgi:hypothetical protein
MKKKFLPIGTAVKIHKESYSDQADNGTRGSSAIVIKKRKPEFDFGIIVGGTYLRTGQVDWGFYDYDNTEPTTFTANGSMFVYLVRRSFLSKPIRVMPEDLETAPDRFIRNIYLEKDRHIIPFSPSVFQWDKNMRSQQAEIMSTIERDEKGRWK